jgi:hypothetical protein
LALSTARDAADDSQVKNFDKNLAPTISMAYTRHKLWSKLTPKNASSAMPRVSTVGQTLDSQLEKLRAAGCSSRNIYREKATGANLTGCSVSSPPATW